ncbi:MAG: translation initiation factor 2 [Rhizobiaceae bacterium]|nr:translation initiation factor 2 [Rhizobiaceae bacterium]
MKNIIAVIAISCLVSGCGTIVRGTTEKVTVITEPSGAAITTSIGPACPSSPCTFDISRSAEFTVYADKPGYKRGEASVGTKLTGQGAAGFAGNVLAGGVVGMGVDAVTGASLDHYPNPVKIELEREGSKASSRKTKRSEKSKPAKAATKPVS